MRERERERDRETERDRQRERETELYLAHENILNFGCIRNTKVCV